MKKILKNSLSSQNVGLAIIILLTIISYGGFQTRGASDDDFCSFKYSLSQSWYNAAYNWKDTYNSRIGQGIIVPALFRLFSSESILNFHWNYFHLVGILFHVGNVILIFLILGIFDLPVFIRLSVPLIFAVHPIKEEAIVWPCAIPVYVIPLFIFLISALFYFLLGKKKYKRNNIYIILIFTVSLLPVLTIEQILPLIPFIMILKYIFFDHRRGTILLEVICFLILTVCFLFITFSGATAAKIDNVTAGKGLYFDFAYAYNSTLFLLYRIIVPPFAYPNNEFVKTELIKLTSNYPMLFLMLISFLLAFILSRSLLKNMQENGKYIVKKTYIWVAISGIIISFFSLTPLFLTKYAIVSRSTYIPMMGVSLVIIGLISIIITLINSLCQWKQNNNISMFLSCLNITMFTFLIGCCLITNLAYQQAHSKSWEIKKNVIFTVKKEFSSIPEDTKIFIFGLPKKIGPSSIFNTSWGLSCAFNSMYESNGISATAIEPIASLLENRRGSGNEMAGIIPFVYHDGQLSPIHRISLLDITRGEFEKREINFPLVEEYSGDRWIFKCLKKEILLGASASGLYEIKGIKFYSLPQIHQIELQVELEPKKEIDQKYAMLCHIFYKDKEIYVGNDKRIPMSGTGYNKKLLSVYFAVMNSDEIEKIRIGIYPLSKHWERLKIDFERDQQFLKKKDNTIEMDFVKLKENLEM